MSKRSEHARATKFLEQKLRETIEECGVPALAAVLVRDEDDMTVSAQLGIRKVGEKGVLNKIQPHDRFNLGSVSKVFTGNLMGKLIQEGIGGLQWTTKLVEVFRDRPLMKSVYKNVTIQQFLVHTSGMPYQPSGDNTNDYKTWTAADLTKPKLMKRRTQYVEAAVADPLICICSDPEHNKEECPDGIREKCKRREIKCQPGDCVHYSGGGVICASMAEQKTGKTYEDLVQEHLYDPLGMTNSGFGELSPGRLDGPWQHGWNAETFTVEPDQDTKNNAWSWHSRNPVGAACCSAADMGKFLREQVRPDPQVFNAAMRLAMQTHQVTTASSFVRGAWSSSAPGSATADISHNGDNGVSYADVVVSLSQKTAYGAMSNVNNRFGAPAVSEMHEVMRVMHDRWSQLFTDPKAKFWECAHPMPAVVFAGRKMIAFGRQHDGRVVMLSSRSGGTSWQAAGSLGGVLTSGLAAASFSSGQNTFVFGRGADHRIWFATSIDGCMSWGSWNPIGSGVFLTGPAVAVSSDGDIVHAFAVGTDGLMYRTRSLNGGEEWIDWESIGQGVFTSAPAVAASSDGKIVHVFGRGTDRRIWRNVSIDSGAGWNTHWTPIGEEIFTSGPGATASTSGAKVHVFGRGTNRRLWRNSTSNSGTDWLEHWQDIPKGKFTSAPSVVSTHNGSRIQIFAFGGDFRIYRNHSTDDGAQWDSWEEIGQQFFL